VSRFAPKQILCPIDLSPASDIVLSWGPDSSRRRSGLKSQSSMSIGLSTVLEGYPDQSCCNALGDLAARSQGDTSSSYRENRELRLELLPAEHFFTNA
jgi:hypothetical protein